MTDQDDTTANGASRHPSQRDSSKYSPVTSLASLEYLQTQRRGSITDPSLHAAPTTVKVNTSYRQHPDPPGSPSSGPSSAHHDSTLKSHMAESRSSDPRPSSPYVFGDATLPSADHNSHLRKLLHSPSSDHRPPSSLSHDSQEQSRNMSASSNSKESSHLNVDRDRHNPTSRRSVREHPSFDFNMRRHSIAVGQNSITLPHLSSTAHGTKRKMSVDRSMFAPVGEDIDPQLVGPGVPSGMDMDADAPAPKRRGSAIDTQRIAQLSLNDRRNSVDRGAQWFVNERRDSAPPVFPNVSSMSPYNPGFNPGDSSHSRLPQSMTSFSWPVNSQPTDQENPSMHTDGDANMSSRPFDSNTHMNIVPSMNYPPDRRMSVPDTLTNPGPTRVLRSRSRPPSRQNTGSGPSSGQEDPVSAPSPNASSRSAKDGATPYSRSPELRVSHKLAERKRRKEMKELFDDLRDQLPADRGMKASKWEILTKAIEFVSHLKQSHQHMVQEVELLRREVETLRQGGMQAYPPSGPQTHPVAYGQVPSMAGQFPHAPSGVMQQHPSGPPHHPGSRPESSHNVYSPGINHSPSQNGNVQPDGGATS